MGLQTIDDKWLSSFDRRWSEYLKATEADRGQCFVNVKAISLGKKGGEISIKSPRPFCGGYPHDQS